MKYSKRQLQIINTAIKIINTEGIRKLTTKYLAQKVGVTEPALYRHFKNKNSILYSILDYFETVSNTVLQANSNDNVNSIDNIQKFVLDRYNLFSENPDLAKIMFSDSFLSEDPILSEKMFHIMHHHSVAIIKTIEEGQKTNEITNEILSIDLFRMIFGSLRLLTTQWISSNYSFNLIQEGKRLWLSIKKLICKI
ncbi:MAG: TetR/AcrR family transcriptional regulator [Candidatus Cloacimonetes bacterium]|jgi:AcrR family transcriptional regulator|nr:TetR/AcrR family transcriptional regulator [Candidatus Cloacimonadota bacterium]